ncbi:MAG: diaminopimelate epimerase [Arcobacteraceae bacterium]|nr:diaminopimelate epimerase [Arcobacteraceae bacterium]
MTYSKYDASGNDFVIFHTDTKKDYSSLAIDLCSKEQFDTDGLIVIVPHPTLDFQWLFYNNDGSVASMCGNGARAVALYAYKNKLASSTMTFLTGAGEITCSVKDNIVETQMTQPYELKTPFKEDRFDCWIVDTGVPHVVIVTDDLNNFNLEICAKFRKKYNANVNFVKVEKDILRVRTFERGVENETLACGTGMVACFLRMLNLNLIKNHIKVYPKSGEELQIRQENKILYFKGAVKFIKNKEII